MRGDFETRLSPIRLGSSVAGAMALLALSLACVGVFGVVSYGAAVRTKEIGIRVTLGAPHSAVIRLLLKQLLWPTAIGMLAGAAVTVPVVGAFRGDPFFLQTFDPLVHVTVIAVLAATVGVAALYPALRALRLDPVGALRYE
jgi:ABC-type antimicrobial peptide transport system permease subunit